MVKVEWSARAVEDLSKLDKPIAQRIIRKAAWFADNFDHITPEALSRDLIRIILVTRAETDKNNH